MNELATSHIRTAAAAAAATFEVAGPQENDKDVVLAGKIAAAVAGMVPNGAFAAITPHDTTALSPPARSIYVGGTGDVVVKNAAGVAVTFTAVPAGMILPIACTIVKATGTTATGLIAL